MVIWLGCVVCVDFVDVSIRLVGCLQVDFAVFTCLTSLFCWFG